MQSSTSATLPRDFRFHYQDGECPRTPEANIQGEPQPPSPPRARLRVKRRNVSNVSGSTEQFLASVAAADVPMPTIEVPQFGEDVQMLDRSATPVPDLNLLVPRSVDFGASPPRTPIPRLFTSMDGSSNQRRDWYMVSGSTFDDVTDRPSSSLSNASDYSDDSFFSGSRISRPSEDGSCTSPESDVLDPFVLLSSSKGKDPSFVSEITSPHGPVPVLNGQMRSKTRHDAPWSKEMSDHLWLTYQVYLQDPTVTPFRMGPSVVPPEGVVHRVAREAKRSWKGPKPAAALQLAKQRLPDLSLDASMNNVENAGSPDTATSKSGSITPTANTAAPKVYLQWHHSSAATRHHLRELCKRKGTNSVHMYRYLQARSPTSFTQARLRNRDRFLAAEAQNAFSTQEIALSLVTSSSQSMQPDGPLTELAKSTQSTNGGKLNQDDDLYDAYRADQRAHRLGSPFTSQTYGPSSSNGFSSFSKPSPPRGKSGTVSATGPYLRSPLRFNHPRSLNGTQKRRAQHALEDELSPNGAVIRPSILDDQLFGGALDSQRRVRSRGFSLGDESFGNRAPGLSEAQVDGANQPSRVSTNSGPNTAKRPVTPLLPSIEFRQTRLGSPFGETGTSNTFPRRLNQQMDGASTIGKRGFATVHHTRRSIESFDFGDGPSLQSRLNHLDEKLAELRDREATGSTKPKQ